MNYFIHGIVLIFFTSSPSTDHTHISDDLYEIHSLLQQWQLEPALKKTEALLIEYPDDTNLHIAASKIQHARGKYRSALSLIHSVSRLSPFNQTLTQLIRHSGGYAQYFKTITTTHFKVNYINECIGIYLMKIQVGLFTMGSVYQITGIYTTEKPFKNGHLLSLVCCFTLLA